MPGSKFSKRVQEEVSAAPTDKKGGVGPVRIDIEPDDRAECTKMCMANQTEDDWYKSEARDGIATLVSGNKAGSVELVKQEKKTVAVSVVILTFGPADMHGHNTSFENQ